MSNHIIPAARKIASKITPAEAMISEAVAANCHLTLSIIEARKSMGLPARAGHSAFMVASSAAASLSQALDQTIRCHELLNEERDSIGLDPQAVGCVPGCTKEGNASPFTGA